MDVGTAVLLIGCTTAIVSFFLPWYSFAVTACGKTVTVSASAFSAGGGRFIILGTVAIIAATSLLGNGLRWVTLLLAITLPVQVLVAMGNSSFSLQGPSCTNATGVPAFAGFPGISHFEPGAYLALASAVLILAGSVLHFATAGHLRERRKEQDEFPNRSGQRSGVSPTGRSVLVLVVALLGGLCGLGLGLLLFGQSWTNSAFFAAPTCGGVRVTQFSSQAAASSTALASSGTLTSCQTRPSPGWILMTGSVGFVIGGYGTTLLLRRGRQDGSKQAPPTPPPIS